MREKIQMKTNTENEAFRALAFVAHHARLARKDDYHWKWVLIGLHNALQSLMVLALEHGSGLRVLKNQIAENWLAAYRSGGPYPEEKLDPYLNLFRKIQGNDMRFYVHSQSLAATESQKSSVKKLNSLRNRFVHFLPGIHVLDVVGLPGICLSCLTVGDFLAWKLGNIFWHTIPPSKVKRVFQAAKTSLESLKP